MSWLGQNGASREDFYALADAYKSMYMQQDLQEDPEALEEKEGKKDACYNKVKSRYSVWPSAYASGALVKCRQKGAKNWGNSSKKEAFDLAVGEMMQEGIDFSDTYEEDAWDAFLFGWEELQEGRAYKAGDTGAGAARDGREAMGGFGGGKQYGIGAGKKEKNDPKADDRRAARQKAQAKEDRRKAALERQEEGEDKISKAIKSVQEAEKLEENRRAARAAGGYKDDSKKQTDPSKPGFTGIGNSIEEIMKQNREIEKRNKEKTKKEESEILSALQDAYAMMYEKKKDSDKCGDDTYWDKEEKKCKSKKKKSGTTVVVGRGGIYGPGYHGGGSGSNGGGDTDTDGGDTDGGGDGGGGGE